MNDRSNRATARFGEAKNVYASQTGIRESVLREIQELAEQNGLTRVVLYGSRARGDFNRTSDIDLAVEGGNTSAFALDVDETTSTLLFFDCVDLGGPVRHDLRAAIDREGMLIYEKDR